MRLALAAVSAAFLFCAGAQAQGCGESDAAYRVLAQEYGERPLVEMRDAHGNRLVLLVNPETGTWTLLVHPAGRAEFACPLGAGTDLAPLDGAAPGRGA